MITNNVSNEVLIFVINRNFMLERIENTWIIIVLMGFRKYVMFWCFHMISSDYRWVFFYPEFGSIIKTDDDSFCAFFLLKIVSLEKNKTTSNPFVY